MRLTRQCSGAPADAGITAAPITDSSRVVRLRSSLHAPTGLRLDWSAVSTAERRVARRLAIERDRRNDRHQKLPHVRPRVPDPIVSRPERLTRFRDIVAAPAGASGIQSRSSSNRSARRWRNGVRMRRWRVGRRFAGLWKWIWLRSWRLRAGRLRLSHLFAPTPRIARRILSSSILSESGRGDDLELAIKTCGLVRRIDERSRSVIAE